MSTIMSKLNCRGRSRRVLIGCGILTTFIMLAVWLNSGGIDSRWENVTIEFEYKSTRKINDKRVMTIAVGSPIMGKRMKQPTDIIESDKGNICQFVPSYRDSDAVIFHAAEILVPNFVGMPRKQDQVWILMSQEAPANIELPLQSVRDAFNLTMTYMHRSDIYIPYGNVGPMPPEEYKNMSKTPRVNYSERKTRLGVARISQCLYWLKANTKRLKYLRELKDHMAIDYFGSCFQTGRCGNECSNEELGKKYKFFFAFENSFCEDYITEKMWHVSFQYNMVPVVRGGLSRKEYERAAPPHSFIYADDFAGPKELADFLVFLDSNDTLYNQYFEWKRTHKLVPLPFFGPLCDKLHDKSWTKTVNLDEEYSGKLCYFPKKTFVENWFPMFL